MADVTALEGEIAQTRRHYAALRAQLEAKIAPGNPGVDTVDHLLSTAEEFGPAGALTRLGLAPADYHLLLPPSDILALEPLLTAIVDADQELDRLVGRREDVLCAEDPARERRYNLQGQDFVYRDSTGKMQIDGAAPVPVHIMAVDAGMGPDGGKSRGKPQHRT